MVFDKGGCFDIGDNFGDGARTGMAQIIMITALKIIQKGLRALPTVLFAAVAGTTNRGSCERLVATSSPRISGTAIWVSALPGQWIEE